jgi:3-methylfumaryl-CoA hydratase
VAAIELKHGLSGEFMRVSLAHELWTESGVALRERQDIIYRPLARGPAVDDIGTQTPHPDAYGLGGPRSRMS